MMRAALPRLTVLAIVLAWCLAPSSAGAQSSPLLSVDDTSVVPGQMVRVWGTCVPAGQQTLPVDLREATVRPLDVLDVQPDGSFSGDVTVPVDAATGVRAQLVARCSSGEVTADIAIIEGGLQPAGAPTGPEDLPMATQAAPVGGVEAGGGGAADAGPHWPLAAGSGLGALILFGGLAVAARRA